MENDILINNLLIALNNYDASREKAIEILTNLYANLGEELLNNENLYKMMRNKEHIEKLVQYVIKNCGASQASIIEKIYQKAYQKGWKNGDRDGFRKGYARGINHRDHQKDDYDVEDAYEQGYREGIEPYKSDALDEDYYEPEIWDEENVIYNE